MGCNAPARKPLDLAADDRRALQRRYKAAHGACGEAAAARAELECVRSSCTRLFLAPPAPFQTAPEKERAAQAGAPASAGEQTRRLRHDREGGLRAAPRLRATRRDAAARRRACGRGPLADPLLLQESLDLAPRCRAASLHGVAMRARFSARIRSCGSRGARFARTRSRCCAFSSSIRTFID